MEMTKKAQETENLNEPVWGRHKEVAWQPREESNWRRKELAVEFRHRKMSKRRSFRFAPGMLFMTSEGCSVEQ